MSAARTSRPLIRILPQRRTGRAEARCLRAALRWCGSGFHRLAPSADLALSACSWLIGTICEASAIGLVVLDDVVHEGLDLRLLHGLAARVHEQRPAERVYLPAWIDSALGLTQP